VNVYAPCDAPSKCVLWEYVKQLKYLDLGGLWCILGDFNSIRHPSERVSVTQREADDNNITEFNDWIADLEVEEVSCVGRKFTWYKPNGAAKRKLDRFFVSDEWISKWPGVTR